MTIEQGAAIGGSFEEQMEAIHLRDKQYAEEMQWRRDQDGRQSRAAALEAAIRIAGPGNSPDLVLRAAEVFEGYLNGMVTLPRTKDISA